MPFSTKRLLSITLILLSLTIGCDRETTRAGSLITPNEENIELLTIGPYTETCQGFIEQTCFSDIPSTGERNAPIRFNHALKMRGKTP